jgi:choline dehydrogenase-like flavoprotein
MSFSGIVHQLRAIMQYRRERRGPMTSNFAECGGFLKTRPDLDVPDIQLHFGMAIVDDHGRKRRWGRGFSCHVCLLRPKSRGSVALHSADPMAAPLIDPNFFGEVDDLGFDGRRLQDHAVLMETPACGPGCGLEEGPVHARRTHRRRICARCCARVTVYHPVGKPRWASAIRGGDRSGLGSRACASSMPR